MVFYPSNSIENIKLNIFSFHSLVIVVIGLILLIVSTVTNSEGGMGENQVYGVLCILLGSVSLYAILKKKIIIVFINLFFIGLVFIADLFINVDSSYTNTPVLAACIVFMPLINIFYGPKHGLIVMVSIIIIYAIRNYLLVNNYIDLPIIDNSGWFDVSIYSIWIIYSVVVFGYYSSTIKQFMQSNAEKEIDLQKQMNVSQNKLDYITGLLNDIGHLVEENDHDINKALKNAELIFEDKNEINYELLQTVGNDISNDLDFILKTINNKIEILANKKNDN